MTAFVAGATGYTGREVVRALVGAGVRTVAHVRPDSAALQDWQARFGKIGAEVDATPWEPGAMEKRLGALAPDVVFALLGTTRARGRGAAGVETYETIDYGLTKLLLDAAAPGRPRFVYLSSAGTGPRARGAYLQARWKTECAVRDSGLPFTIARPSFIAGRDRDDERLGERVGATVADGALALAGALGARRLRDRYRSTTNVTLAAALVRLALDPGAAGATVESEDLRVSAAR